MSKIIGLCGRARAGKSTVAQCLVSYHAYGEDSFAAPIRRFVADILGWTLTELETHKEAPIDWLPGETPRRMMQTVGTEWGRQRVHPDLWVESCVRRAQTWPQVVISDVRFENEAAAIRARGGEVWQVVRPGHESIAADHPSEAGIPDALIDRIIVNDGSIDDLYARVAAVLRR